VGKEGGGGACGRRLAAAAAAAKLVAVVALAEHHGQAIGRRGGAPPSRSWERVTRGKEKRFMYCFVILLLITIYYIRTVVTGPRVAIYLL
jgi:hypothetical protein